MSIFDQVLSKLYYVPRNIYIDTLYTPITDEDLKTEPIMLALYKGYTKCECSKPYTTFVRFVKTIFSDKHTTAVVCRDCLHHLTDILLRYREVPFNYYKKQWPGANPMFERRSFVKY